MPNDSCLEVKPDSLRTRNYASRNHNDLRHTYAERWGSDRSQVDWAMQLRQIHPRLPKPKSKEGGLPARESRKKPSLTKNPEEGEYNQEKFYRRTHEAGARNTLSTSANMLRGTLRPANKEQVCFQMSLRDAAAIGDFENQPWRRYYARSQVSFDRMKQAIRSERFAQSFVTPFDREPDRSGSALPIATLREAGEYLVEGGHGSSCGRASGCEGTAVNNWRQLMDDRTRGVHRSVLGWETTLRDFPDNRSNHCVVDMLGKKRWHGVRALDETTFMDPKLEYIKEHKILAEPFNERKPGTGDQLSLNVSQ